MNTEPQHKYRSPCASVRLNNHGPRNVRALYQVIDHSDGEAVVDTFRNRVLADRLAALSPAYEVREFSLTNEE